MTLTAADLATIRRAASRDPRMDPISYTKADLDTTVQALEDYWDGAQTVTPAGTLDAAVQAGAGYAFSASQLEAIKSAWMDWKKDNI